MILDGQSFSLNGAALVLHSHQAPGSVQVHRVARGCRGFKFRLPLSFLGASVSLGNYRLGAVSKSVVADGNSFAACSQQLAVAIVMVGHRHALGLNQAAVKTLRAP